MTKTRLWFNKIPQLLKSHKHLFLFYIRLLCICCRCDYTLAIIVNVLTAYISTTFTTYSAVGKTSSPSDVKIAMSTHCADRTLCHPLDVKNMKSPTTSKATIFTAQPMATVSRARAAAARPTQGRLTWPSTRSSELRATGNTPSRIHAGGNLESPSHNLISWERYTIHALAQIPKNWFL